MTTYVPAAVRSFAAGRGLTSLRRAGGGVEFEVHAAATPGGPEVVLRTPAAGRFRSSANDRHVDTRVLLRELARLAEYALLPDSGLDDTAVMSGYGARVPADSAAFWIYRLDAAVMLALLFCSERPGTGLGRRAVDRLGEVHDQLAGKLAGR